MIRLILPFALLIATSCSNRHTTQVQQAEDFCRILEKNERIEAKRRLTAPGVVVFDLIQVFELIVRNETRNPLPEPLANTAAAKDDLIEPKDPNSGVKVDRINPIKKDERDPIHGIDHLDAYKVKVNADYYRRVKVQDLVTCQEIDENTVR